MRIGSGVPKLIFGPPGCGKTTRLLELMEQKLAEGVPPSRMAYVSFTRKAAAEAVERVERKFDLTKENLPFFKTLHALTYGYLGITQEQMLTKGDYCALGEELNLPITGDIEEDCLPLSQRPGDICLAMDTTARCMGISIDEYYQKFDERLIDRYSLQRFCEALTAFKKSTGKLDFTDLLETFIATGEPLDVDVVFIDEAQDLSRLQWLVCLLAFSNCPSVYIAGDDDQSIYVWAGAEVETFLSLEAEREVLGVSHRLPRTVHALAKKIVDKVSVRQVKEFTCRDDDGLVEYIQGFESIEPAEGTWYFLVRNKMFIPGIESWLRRLGYPFVGPNGVSVKKSHVRAIRAYEKMREEGSTETLTKAETDTIREYLSPRFEGVLVENLPIWHEALTGIPAATITYYLNCLRNKQRLDREPRIRVATIHSVKGGEADHVVVMPDMTRRTYQEYRQNPDTEHRVFYVAVTRARYSLRLVIPSTPTCYEFL